MREAARRPIEVPDDGRPVFTMCLRVRYYEMDILGHVNNAVYLNYLEHVAIEHTQSLGFDHARLRELGGQFVVRRHEIDYLGAAVAGDELAITTWPEQMSGARALRGYLIADAATNRRLVTARTLWAWVDLHSFAPRPIPQEILDAFASRPRG
jgi:acyl-CoA thioester hydrolase